MMAVSLQAFFFFLKHNFTACSQGRSHPVVCASFCQGSFLCLEMKWWMHSLLQRFAKSPQKAPHIQNVTQTAEMKLLGPRECTKDNHSSQGRCFWAPAQNQLIPLGGFGPRSTWAQVFRCACRRKEKNSKCWLKANNEPLCSTGALTFGVSQELRPRCCCCRHWQETCWRWTAQSAAIRHNDGTGWLSLLSGELPHWLFLTFCLSPPTTPVVRYVLKLRELVVFNTTSKKGSAQKRTLWSHWGQNLGEV